VAIQAVVFPADVDRVVAAVEVSNLDGGYYVKLWGAMGRSGTSCRKREGKSSPG
jgi:hypothetical protein